MQAPSSSCVVPSELQLDVIEYLHDDEDALHNCSLVSKKWAECSRSYLWEKIALIRKDEAGVVSEKHTAPVIVKEAEYFFRPTSIEDATAFFTANPIMAKLVKKLRIDGFIGVTVNTLSSLLTALPNFATSRSSIPTSHPSLKLFQTLTACNIVERDIDMLLRVLGLFSSIDLLDFEGSDSAFDKIQAEGWSFDPAIHLRHNVPYPPLPEHNAHAEPRNSLDLISKRLGTLKRFNFTPGPSMAVNLPQGVEEHEEIDKVFTSIAKSCASVEHITLQLVHNVMPEPLDFSYLVDGFVKVLERLPPSMSPSTCNCY
ncbi:hypothetical protein GSI_04428 [Ganoderma sinense ZZ0214-1]|uniref:F-box domain-containing protein n=1 Tax=Ganoderma sinense ZZ0214-1 TaxID=1077348 RepID=A0A2G8SJ51_9APHY|nr:hypothetical protein GSI_04428 [Ganoderma sinense ZZ0214-1]